MPTVSYTRSPGVSKSEVSWQTQDEELGRETVESHMVFDSCLAFDGILLKSVTAKLHCNKPKKQLLWSEKFWPLLVLNQNTDNNHT